MIVRAISTAIAMVLMVNMASCQSSNSGKTADATVQTINVTDFATKLKASTGAQLVDVRTPQEFAEGHLQNALNVNYNANDFAEQIAKLDKTKAVYVYCRSGGRSGSAVRQMQEMGFTEIYNMDGGILSWKGEVVK